MDIHWIGFDADDTLWVNERLYREARTRFDALLASYGIDLAVANRRVDEIEVQNLQWYGYGVMSFGLSLIEAAVDLTQGRISGQGISQVLELTKDMITAEVELLEGAEQALAELSSAHPLLLITKGEPNHQHSKIERSGLRRHFRQVEIVPDKTPASYAEILKRQAVEPERFLMVGNSLKSDILPVVAMGGWAIHIPSDLTWEHEVVEIPPELRSRVFEVAALSELAPFIDTLKGSGTDRETPARRAGTG
jgi:putative hydrolase of the HAD superfamily